LTATNTTAHLTLAPEIIGLSLATDAFLGNPPIPRSGASDVRGEPIAQVRPLRAVFRVIPK